MRVAERRIELTPLEHELIKRSPLPPGERRQLGDLVERNTDEDARVKFALRFNRVLQNRFGQHLRGLAKREDFWSRFDTLHSLARLHEKKPLRPAQVKNVVWAENHRKQLRELQRRAR